MHYKNGREANPGDVIIDLSTGQKGVLYDTIAGTKQCSARISNIHPNDFYVTTSNCLHLDDIAKATIPDSTKSE